MLTILIFGAFIILANSVSTGEEEPSPVDWWLDVYVYALPNATVINSTSPSSNTTLLTAAVNAKVLVIGYNYTGYYVADDYWDGGETYSIPLGFGIAEAELMENGTVVAKAHIEFTFPRPPTHYRFPILVLAWYDGIYVVENETSGEEEYYLFNGTWGLLGFQVYYNSWGYVADGYNSTIEYIKKTNAIELERWGERSTNFPDYDQMLRELIQEYNITFIIDEHTINIYAVYPQNYTKLPKDWHKWNITTTSTQPTELQNSLTLPNPGENSYLGSNWWYCELGSEDWCCPSNTYIERKFVPYFLITAETVKVGDAYSTVDITIKRGAIRSESYSIGARTLSWDPPSIDLYETGYYKKIININGGDGSASGNNPYTWVTGFYYRRWIFEKVGPLHVEYNTGNEVYVVCYRGYIYHAYPSPYGELGDTILASAYRLLGGGWGNVEDSMTAYREFPPGDRERSVLTGVSVLEKLGLKLGVGGTVINFWASVELEKGYETSIEIIGRWYDSPSTVNCTVYMLGRAVDYIYVADPWADPYIPEPGPDSPILVPKPVRIDVTGDWFTVKWDMKCP